MQDKHGRQAHGLNARQEPTFGGRLEPTFGEMPQGQANPNTDNLPLFEAGNFSATDTSVNTSRPHQSTSHQDPAAKRTRRIQQDLAQQPHEAAQAATTHAAQASTYHAAQEAISHATQATASHAVKTAAAQSAAKRASEQSAAMVDKAKAHASRARTAAAKVRSDDAANGNIKAGDASALAAPDSDNASSKPLSRFLKRKSTEDKASLGAASQDSSASVNDDENGSSFAAQLLKRAASAKQAAQAKLEELKDKSAKLSNKDDSAAKSSSSAKGVTSSQEPNANRYNEEEEIEGNFLYQWRERRRMRKARKAQEKADRKAGLIPPLTIGQRLGRITRFCMSLGIKLAIVGLGLGTLMFIYFDNIVYSGYEVDDKWVLPAVVYSRPLELYPDQRLSLEQMVYELKMLQYREVASPKKPGEYAVNKKTDRVVLIKRPFKFPDGEEQILPVMVEFDGKRVNRILNANTLQELAFMRMDPVLLDRINRINPEEDRIFISLDAVPQQLITTLIEIEDRAYYDHFGINPLGIARAAVKNAIAGRVVEGGSTITQQLVKNYFLTNERSYSRKIKEIFMAIAMNHRYTKDQILEAYMNEIYLGQNGNAGIYGFGLASYFYFGVPISELSLDQMALLVGLIKGPSYYDPWRYPDNALSRRNTVLSVLHIRGHISEERCAELQAKPLNVIKRGQMNYSKTPAFMGLVKTEIGYRFKEEEERTGKDFLSGNGIRIFTSLDPQAQFAAEKAVTEQIKAIEKERKKSNLEAAMVVSSWRTGEVSALVGSSNPKYDGYNRALDSRRQVGSLIKPFVYLTAFHQGYHLGSVVNDSPVQVKLPNGDIWSPKNDDKQYRGPIRVINAMAKSLNVPTVRVGMGSGLDNVVHTLKAAGYKRDIPLYPSIVLGTPEISPYELNSMYVGMATEGIYRDLTTLRTIEKDGEIVYQRGSNRSPRTLDPKDTYLAIYGMTEATRSGTGRRIGNMFPGVTIASKTGTTNDFRDSWTVGMDSDELATIWVGYDNNKSTGLYGSTGAMRLYQAYLQERGVNSLELKRPEGVVFANFDKAGNVLASGCEEVGMESYPAREDRIQYIKQCNNFGEAGYEELPYAVPQNQQLPENYAPYQDPRLQGQAPANAQIPGNVQIPSNVQIPGLSNMQPAPQGSLFAPGPASPNVGVANNAAQQNALQGSGIEDSGAKDVEPVEPDDKAQPTQQSSSNIERQADAFEDELLNIF